MTIEPMREQSGSKGGDIGPQFALLLGPLTAWFVDAVMGLMSSPFSAH